MQKRMKKNKKNYSAKDAFNLKEITSDHCSLKRKGKRVQITGNIRISNMKSGKRLIVVFLQKSN